MHLPRTFYEEFAARWPLLFKLAEKYVDRLAPAEPGVLPGDVFLTLSEMIDRGLSGPGADRDLSVELGRVCERELGHRPVAGNQSDIDFFQSINSVTRTLMGFMFYHKRTFFIQPNLVQRLAHTTLDIEAADLHLPFPVMMLVLDDPISREAAHAHWPSAGPLSVLAYEHAVEGERAFQFSPVSARPEVPAPWIMTIRQSMHLTEAMVKQSPLLKIVANALDYIEHPWDEVAHVSVKTPSHTLSKKISKMPYINVGHRYPTMETPPLGSKTGHKLGHRVFVMGHGRNQRHGHRNSLVKRIRGSSRSGKGQRTPRSSNGRMRH